MQCQFICLDRGSKLLLIGQTIAQIIQCLWIVAGLLIGRGCFLVPAGPEPGIALPEGIGKLRRCGSKLAALLENHGLFGLHLGR